MLLSEYQLECLLSDGRCLTDDERWTVCRVVDQLLHRIRYEGLPLDKALLLGRKWLDNREGPRGRLAARPRLFRVCGDRQRLGAGVFHEAR